MKKRLFAAVALLLALCLFSGCAPKTQPAPDPKDDPDTLTITFGMRDAERFIAGLEQQFPDIHFLVEPTYCTNQSEFLRMTLLTDNTSDIFYFTQKAEGAVAAEHLLDLSGYDFISNFDRAVLNTYIVNGRIYEIPGPVSIRCMAYNKTLFQQHGWKKPENHQELVALCRQIRAETDDITPIGMSMGAVGYPFTVVTTFSQAGFLGTPAGEAWESRFLAGEASVAEGWGEGLQMTAELIDAGAFNPAAYLGLWDGASMELEFAVGKAAMFAVWGGQAALLRMMEDSPYEFALMPFYGIEPGEMTIGATANFSWGIPRRLAEPGNERKLANALRVLEWFSTPEGQDLMKTTIQNANGAEVPTTAEISPLNAANEDHTTSPYFVELWELAARGNKMPMIYSGYESVIVDGGTVIQEAMLAGSSAGMAERFVSVVDADYQEHLAGGDAAVLCTVAEDFSEPETAQVLANAMQETALADLALVTHTGRAARGLANLSGAGARLFAGRLTNGNYNIILSNLKNVQILTLTGAQIKQLLSEGKPVASTFDPGETFAFPYYWAGLDVELGSDGTVKSAKHNGTELADDGLYRVAFCYGDYPETLAEAAVPQDSGVPIGQVWLDYLMLHSPLSPPAVLRG